MIINPIKVMKTLFFLDTWKKKINNLTMKDMRAFVLDTWGAEILQLMAAGKFEMADFFNYINMPDADREKWVMKMNEFILSLKKSASK